ncbi:hypothetical protein GCM10011379_45250 [Filimonas zeae]|uniref:Uncharacterized protein n=2 Tax=Filimonas zeae TaxID=1737353 RepID=A0A917J266_9BACT|nr:hypothetical protein GCM10011379_45250 [Filimonas zeae]
MNIQAIRTIIEFYRNQKKETELKSYMPFPDYSRYYKSDNVFTNEFYSNLIRTINWTEKIIKGLDTEEKINYSRVLRSVNPDYEGVPFYRYDEALSSYASTPGLSFDYLKVLDKALKPREDSSFVYRDINLLGQILEFYIDVTTHDGAPAAETDGFIDESDIPPIDTWFYLTRTKLYCWIPKMFIRTIENACEVEILDSYRWVKDEYPALQMQVEEGLKAMHPGF